MNQAIHTTEVSLPAFGYLARLAPGSRPAQVSALRTIASRLGGVTFERYPWHELTRTQTSAVRAWLVEHYAPATANRHLAALRGVLREAWRSGRMPDAEYRRASDLPQVKASRVPAGREASARDLELLFAAAGATGNPTRNRAILAVLYGAGLRRSELAALKVGDVDLDSGELTIRAGKGRKDRVAWLGHQALCEVRAWAPHPGDPDRDTEASLFGVSAAAVYKMVRLAARRAGLEQLTPHDLRRTFVSRLLDRGADLSVVQQLAGHSDIQTTARYDRRGERAKQAAAQLLEVPA